MTKTYRSSIEKQPRHARTVRRGGQRRGAGAVSVIARAKTSEMVRAEGLTEMVGDIEVAVQASGCWCYRFWL